ncbi:unnamed protein product [Medioppia subpectinata]|uniref:rRNA methyltransferase 2, mitochondrial n=1 Tax=Medioppia subpectinata TaxID=1979941 RepID=A0A7R9PV56_9ACAR|nr:unnamed protein product [Medioppia subpectinata]CAG2101927.1 unnamed protein product [Medioppia subpectinata]
MIIECLLRHSVGKRGIRCIHTSQRLAKEALKNSKNKSQSSQEWLRRQLNDPYVRRARYENYRARSVFKLMEMDEKYGLLSPGMIVVDCGAAPGAWTQYVVQRLKLDASEPHTTGAVIGVDIRPIQPIAGAILLSNTDFTKPLNQSKILHSLNGKSVDVVLSDMAPNASGQHDFDSMAIHALCYSALQFSLTVLRPFSGTFVTKVWEGPTTPALRNDLSVFFSEVKHLRPDACRGDSTESYILCRHFKGVKR